MLGSVRGALDYAPANSSVKTAKFLEKQGNIDGSIALYKEILSKNPNHKASIRNLKNLFMSYRKYEDGIKFYKGRMESKIDDHKDYADLGEFYYLDGQHDKASKTWKMGMKKFINNRTYYRSMFSVYSKYGLNTDINLLLKIGRKRFGASFLTYESGVYYQAIKAYDLAMDQFVLNLVHNSRQIGLIERRVLVMSDDEDALPIMEQKLLDASRNYPTKTLDVLSQFYFKQQKYKESYNKKKELNNYIVFDPNEWLLTADNFREEGQYKIAIDTYNYIMTFEISSFLKGKALLGLAQAFEDQIIPSNEINIIPYFFGKNIFFEDPFQVHSDISKSHLSRSIALYDSMLISLDKSPLQAEAHFKLGEIQYRILQDFDQAYILYNRSLQSNPNKLLKTKVILRIIDVLIARGQKEEAKSFIARQLRRSPSKELRLKNIYFSFLTEKASHTLALIDSFKFDLTPIDPEFNDLIELNNMIIEYFDEEEDSENAFVHFQKSEYLLKQKKIGDAIEELIYIKNTLLNQKIGPLIDLRLAILYYRLKDFDNALKVASLLEDTRFADIGIIFMAEIFEKSLLNPEKAKNFYMRILDEYPSSIYAEPVRYHIRELQNITNS